MAKTIVDSAVAEVARCLEAERRATAAWEREVVLLSLAPDWALDTRQLAVDALDGERREAQAAVAAAVDRVRVRERARLAAELEALPAGRRAQALTKARSAAEAAVKALGDDAGIEREARRQAMLACLVAVEDMASPPEIVEADPPPDELPWIESARLEWLTDPATGGTTTPLDGVEPAQPESLHVPPIDVPPRPAPLVEPAPVAPASLRSARRWMVPGAIAAALLVLVGIAAVVVNGGNDDNTTVSANTSVITVAPTSTTTPAVVGLDPVGLSGACAAIPTGSVGGLAPARVGTNRDDDPRTHVPTPWVGVGFTGRLSEVRDQNPPFSVTAVLLAPGTAPGRGAKPIDRLGAVQLVGWWDGSAYHKAIRRWDGRAWKAVVDNAATELTLSVEAGGVALYWTGLTPGTRFGFVVATAQGCVPVALDASLRPVEPVHL